MAVFPFELFMDCDYSIHKDKQNGTFLINSSPSWTAALFDERHLDLFICGGHEMHNIFYLLLL